MVNLRQQSKVINKKRQTSDIAHLCLHKPRLRGSELNVDNWNDKSI